MGKKGTGLKRVILGFCLALGMIAVATLIAVASFFLSIPVKHTGHRAARQIATKSSPGLKAAATPEKGLQKLAGTGGRDPFLPPAGAWPYLKTVAADPGNGKQPAPTDPASGTRRHPGVRPQKSKAVSGKSPVKNLPGGKVSSPEQPDPNSPEAKEILVLPGISRAAVAGDVTYTNADIGLKINYKVKRGDTIGAVSQKFGVAKEYLSPENGFHSAADKLPEGKILIIPIPKNHLYQLKAKETLWRIATRYGITVALLQEINNITDLSKLESGRTIVLPVPVTKIINKNY